MINCAVIIPALNPTEKLIDYVRQLKSQSIAEIIVVNDGSGEPYIHIFDTLHTSGICTVLTHEVNRGKGRSLKTAFHYYLEHFSHLEGVVTADSDGQHAVSDVINLAKLLKNNDHRILLGVRDFDQTDVPIKSLMGNKLTTFFFQLLFGEKLKDTQTGLRGIPTQQLPEIAKLKGERYEYEILMLIYARKLNLSIIEIPIQTIYFNNNSGSHYHPIYDSLKIFKKMITGFVKYFYTVIIAAIIDFFCFISLNSILLAELAPKVRILFATIFARILSTSSNFYMNRKIRTSPQKSSGFSYALLFLSNIFITYFLLTFTTYYLNLNIIIAKLSIDVIIGLLFYQLHQYFIANKHKKESLVGEHHER
ncbi:dolichol-phosphate mannosyltransferase [Lysinibacillus sp. PLM2]|nr:dolichol-phosphate mannosyltransferase [Lysinibacillus sp. PLM2]